MMGPAFTLKGQLMSAWAVARAEVTQSREKTSSARPAHPSEVDYGAPLEPEEMERLEAIFGLAQSQTTKFLPSGKPPPPDQNCANAQGVPTQYKLYSTAPRHLTPSHYQWFACYYKTSFINQASTNRTPTLLHRLNHGPHPGQTLVAIPC